MFVPSGAEMDTQRSQGRGLARRPGIFHSNASRRVLLRVCLLVIGTICAPGSLRAQHETGPVAGAEPQVGMRGSDAPPLSPQVEQQMAERRNVERQKALEADTQKLLALAQQLHDEVAKTNKDQLSIAVVKKSEEIEKLARSVKEKMRGY